MKRIMSPIVENDMDKKDSSCTGKKLFNTFARAKSEAKRMNNTKKHAKVRAYKCNYCNSYHLGGTKYVFRQVLERLC